MKKNVDYYSLLILFLCILFNCCWVVKAQNLCDGHEKPVGGVPEELYRGRLKKQGALYGNPYTLMDRTRFRNANDGFVAIPHAAARIPSRGLTTTEADTTPSELI